MEQLVVKVVADPIRPVCQPVLKGQEINFEIACNVVVKKLIQAIQIIIQEQVLTGIVHGRVNNVVDGLLLANVVQDIDRRVSLSRVESQNVDRV